jgi:hypothetical protein
MNAMNADNATRQEAAAYLRVSQTTLRRWERHGKGPEVSRISRNVALYPWAALRAFLSKDLKGAR